MRTRHATYLLPITAVIALSYLGFMLSMIGLHGQRHGIGGQPLTSLRLLNSVFLDPITWAVGCLLIIAWMTVKYTHEMLALGVTLRLRAPHVLMGGLVAALYINYYIAVAYLKSFGIFRALGTCGEARFHDVLGYGELFYAISLWSLAGVYVAQLTAAASSLSAHAYAQAGDERALARVGVGLCLPQMLMLLVALAVLFHAILNPGNQEGMGDELTLFVLLTLTSLGLLFYNVSALCACVPSHRWRSAAGALVKEPIKYMVDVLTGDGEDDGDVASGAGDKKKGKGKKEGKKKG